MPSLFSYISSVDDGAAPNPFGGICTLAICKPVIRRTAKPGDWIAGLGSKRAPSGDLSGKIVYAMKVERVVTLRDYDRLVRSNSWPRLPDFETSDHRDRLGDCIYDFSSGSEPRLRRSVHDHGNRKTDLSGQNVLISRDFYYFGKKAKKLPSDLLGIVHQNQGHRKAANHRYFPRFEEWIRKSGWEVGKLYGDPDFEIDWDNLGGCKGCIRRRKQGESDGQTRPFC